MKTPWGQIDLRYILTAIVTAVLLGGGGVIWGLVKPEPDLAVERALLRRDVDDLKARMQRIEESLKTLLEVDKKRR